MPPHAPVAHPSAPVSAAERIQLDIECGDAPFLLSELPDQSFVIRPRGKKLNRCLGFRWKDKGLDVMGSPSGFITTKAAYFRFCNRLSGVAVPTRTPARRQREHLSAVSKLEKAGI